eukprot:5515233-Prymnesium_polylepis.1
MTSRSSLTTLNLQKNIADYLKPVPVRSIATSPPPAPPPPCASPRSPSRPGAPALAVAPALKAPSSTCPRPRRSRRLQLLLQPPFPPPPPAA